jgi:predicted nucleotidyltransferase component of viral defense system
MLTFVERLNRVSNEFVFKGGNLLWMYINTPRVTVDLDFATKSISEHKEVKQILTSACLTIETDVKFQIETFKEVNKPKGRGAAVVIQYRTEQGQQNKFEMDIVYAVSSQSSTLQSTIDGENIQVVTIENIIADKLAASHSFAGGNTRMKDFDDLWRISAVTGNSLNWKILKKFLEERNLQPTLDKNWINKFMLSLWSDHTKDYEDLPKNLESLFDFVNDWLKQTK